MPPSGLLARTTPLEDCKKPTDGLSLFYTNLDRRFVDVREIEKLGRKCVDSNELFIDKLPVSTEELTPTPWRPKLASASSEYR